MPQDPKELETEGDVRDLLADVGDALRNNSDDAGDETAGETLPDDVVDRLEDALAALVAARSADHPVTALDTRRARTAQRRPGRIDRRGWLAAAGIAAAAMVAVLAVPQMLGQGARVGDDVRVAAQEQEDRQAEAPRSTAGDAPEEVVELSGPLTRLTAPGTEDENLDPEGIPSAESGDVEEGRRTTLSSGAGHRPYAGLPSQAPRVGVPKLRTATLAADVVALLANLPDSPPGTASADSTADSTAADSTAAACTWRGEGTAYDVSLDGRGAFAVVSGGTTAGRTVRLVVCDGSGETVQMATALVPPALVPAP